MTIDEIKILLKRKKENCLKEVSEAISRHDHNSQSFEDYYSGKAAGIEEALGVLGMLGNEHNRINIK